MKTQYTLGLAIMLGFTPAASLQAQTAISLNVVGGFNGTVPTATDEAGVVLVPNWNNTVNSDATVGQTIDNLVDSFGSSTAASVTIGGSYNTFGVSFAGVPGQDTDGSYNRNMLLGYVNSGNNLPGTFTFSSIPYAQYDVYVYFGSDTATRTGSVTDGTTTYYWGVLDGMVSDPSGNALFAQTTSTDDTVFPESNYAVFSGLTDTDLVISGSGLTDFTGISAIQIVQVPEPSTYAAMAGIIGLAVVAMRRRRS